MVCDLLNWKCIFVNELIGSSILTLVLGFILATIVASKLQLKFRTSIFLLTSILIIGGMMISSFTTIFTIATIGIGLVTAWVWQRIIKNN